MLASTRLILAGLIICTVVAFTLWVHLLQFSAYPVWDSNVFLLIGRWFSRGMLPYRDLFEPKPPGIFFYLAAVDSILPSALWSVRVADFFVDLLGAAAFYRLCRVQAHWGLALGGTLLWLYFAQHPAFSESGVYTEQYSAILAIFAVLAAATYSASGRTVFAFASGVAVAGAALCKHPGASAALPALILIASRPRPRALGGFVAGGIRPASCVLVFFWLQGGLQAFLDCNLWWVLEYSEGRAGAAPWLLPRLSEAVDMQLAWFRGFPVMAAAAVIGLLATLLRPNRFRIAVLSWVLLDFLMIATQGHYYAHHYIQGFPALFLYGVIGAAWLLEPRRGERWYLSTARLLVAGGLCAIAWPSLSSVWSQRQPSVALAWQQLGSGPSEWRTAPGKIDEESIAAYIRQRTDSDAKIHVHAWNPTAIATYWLADRRPASRFFTGVRLAIAYEEEQLRELEQSRPDIFVLVGELPFPAFQEWLVANYTLETVMWQSYRAEIWVRQDLQQGSGSGGYQKIGKAVEDAGKERMCRAGEGQSPMPAVRQRGESSLGAEFCSRG